MQIFAIFEAYVSSNLKSVTLALSSSLAKADNGLYRPGRSEQEDCCECLLMITQLCLIKTVKVILD